MKSRRWAAGVFALSLLFGTLSLGEEQSGLHGEGYTAGTVVETDVPCMQSEEEAWGSPQGEQQELLIEEQKAEEALEPAVITAESVLTNVLTEQPERPLEEQKAEEAAEPTATMAEAARILIFAEPNLETEEAVAMEEEQGEMALAEEVSREQEKNAEEPVTDDAVPVEEEALRVEEEPRGITGEELQEATEEVPQENTEEGPETMAPDTESLLRCVEGNEKTQNGDPENPPAGAGSEISAVNISPVETNPRYSQLSFSFAQGEQEYTCLVTGIEEKTENAAEAYQKLAESIVDSFLAGRVFTLSNQTAEAEYGLQIDLIDAEKTNRFTGEDSRICWAASASDMLEFAGWNKAERSDASGNEDSIFQDFRDHFNNLGGYQTSGISWYLDGVNPEQSIYKGSGEIAYNQTRTSGAAQQDRDSGGYWPEYAASEAAPETGAYDEVGAQLEDAADKLAEGYAVGLGTYYYRDENTMSAGHALSVFGYIREKLNQAAAAIRALLISDSDNRATGRDTAAPEDRPNEYSMYTVTPFENSQGSAIQLENYDQTSLTAVIGMVSTLQPKAQAEQDAAGTQDAVHFPNLVPVDVKLSADGEVKAGAVVELELDLENRAYTAVPENATVRYAVQVYRNGEKVEQKEYSLTTEKINPNRSIAGSAQLLLDQPGEYEFRVEILEISTAEGKPIQEAYLRDNSYQGVPRRLTVRAAEGQQEEGSEKATETSDSVNVYSAAAEGEEEAPGLTAQAKNHSAGTGGEETTPAYVEKIYRLTVILATDTEFELEFEAPAADPEDFLRLWDRKTGETVDPENYQISGETGRFTIAFTEAFIRGLKPGHNDFALTGPRGRVLIRISIY